MKTEDFGPPRPTRTRDELIRAAAAAVGRTGNQTRMEACVPEPVEPSTVRPRRTSRRALRNEVDCLLGELREEDYAVFGDVVGLATGLSDRLRDAVCLLPEENEGAACRGALLDALEAVEDAALSLQRHFGHLHTKDGVRAG